MAITLSTDTARSMELTDCVGVIEKNLKSDDLESLVESAILLKQLANNSSFLIDHVNRSLGATIDPSAHAVGDTSICLAKSDAFCVRANVWAPPHLVAADGRWQANIASYVTPHDHPFSFATVGYMGPGYTTTIFEYDRASIAGLHGEHVDLRYLETTTLPAGKVMVYRACQDVHFQEHPSSFSISLNLISYPKKTVEQYAFDIRRTQLMDSAMTCRRSQTLLCAIAGVIGDARTSNVLEEVSNVCEDEVVRLSAFTAWASLERYRSEEIWRIARTDLNQCIREHAECELRLLT